MAAHIKQSANYVWSLKDVLGTGATSVVCKGHDKKSGLNVAVKTFNSSSYMRPYAVQKREFDVMQKIRHENIVNLLAVEEEQTSRSRILVMELCITSLQGIMEQPTNAYGLEEQEFLTVTRDIASGMKHLRDKSIVHRDIKPGNILQYIRNDGSHAYKLTDFGAAKVLQEDDEQFMSLYGTEEYLFPDMYERAVLRCPGYKQFDATVDLWSVGVTLYQMATGHLPYRPFHGRKDKDMMFYITTKKAPGVISGVQTSENGTVEWARDLPKTSQLTRGLTKHVVPMLGGLMECNQSQMMPFDTFFTTVENLTSSRVIHIFNTCTGNLLYVYMQNDQGLMKLQDAVAEQTDVPPGRQLLMFEGAPLDTLLEPLQTVATYPRTAHEKPYFLFYQGSLPTDLPMLDEVTIPPKPLIPLREQIASDPYDVATTKKVAADLYVMWRHTRHCMDMQDHLSHAVPLFLEHLSADIKEVKAYVQQFARSAEERDQRLSLLHHMGALLQALRGMGCDTLPPTPWLDDLTNINTIFKKDFHRILEVVGHTEDYYRSVIQDTEERKRRIANVDGALCSPKENCMLKMKMKTRHAEAAWDTFRNEKAHKKQLQHHDREMHMFEKIQMKRNLEEAHAALTGYCVPQLETVFRKFKQFYEWASKVGHRLSNLRKEVLSLSDKQQQLKAQIDTIQEDLRLEQEQLMSQLSSNPSLGDRQSLISQSRVHGTQASQDTPSSTFSIERMTALEKSHRKQKALIKQLKDSLKILCSETYSVKEELKNSTQLFKELESLSLNNCQSLTSVQMNGSLT